jgi:hypothetical protein
MTAKTVVTRRSFIAAGAVAGAGTLALPGAALAGSTPADWRSHLAGLRTAYLAELERFAEELRPRFEAGELRAGREGDNDWDDPPKNPKPTPQDKVDALVAKRFGLEVIEGDSLDGDATAAWLILAASPHADPLEDEWQHPCYHAMVAAGWDLIALARERGWYTPTRDEHEDPTFGCCDGCGDWITFHEEDGCHGGDCGCTVAHTPHVNPEREKQARG